ncbi:ankyrin repeat domain-containing protein [Candidatus Pacearchaeota archaeon]|nr:ankyrin repeat domain-containing protein [Candidatus Pacearchaeota archaeon]
MEQIYTDHEMEQMYKDYDLGMASYYNKIESVIQLINDGANYHVDNDYPLRVASIYGNFDIVKYLIPLYNNKEELKTLFFRVNNFYVKYLILERLYELQKF